MANEWLAREGQGQERLLPSPPLTWQHEASGLLAPELNWGAGGGEGPGALDDRLGSILRLLVTPVLISLKRPLLYVP